MRSRLLVCALLLALHLAAPAQKMQTSTGEAPGPWILGTVGVGKGADGKTPKTTALKGMAIKIGAQGEASVAYDLDLCRLVGGWSGKFTTPMNLMSRGEYPTAIGGVAFTTEETPGFRTSAAAAAARPKFGPLPAGEARFKGFYVNGGRVILKWEVGGKPVLEMPAFREGKFVRLIEGSAAPLEIQGAIIEKTEALSALTKGGPPRWPEAIETRGEPAKAAAADADAAQAYVVDTIRLPEANPWDSPFFTSGFDFFEDGRAAVCTFHGDVFVVSGIDADLEKVTWRRFASGLYHALGLRVVKGEIFVTCRDGLWRLNDLNRDGECDFYEAFNFDSKVTRSFHEFTFDLQTDPAGNFYFAKAGPVKNGGRGFDEIMDQHGTLMRVSPDGKKLDVVATGFRAPNGIGVGPHGELTSGDNEGTWTPACKINWIQPGGFYGVVDLAHRTPPPTDYDRPLCWLPKRVDNSGGSQVWAPEGERWGPWGGKMLHLSYGQSALYGVLMEEIEDAKTRVPKALVQGGVTRFPLQFQSGIMRARFNPKDGQLYVMGLRGWQTNGLKNGCFQRVRYTGAVARMPIEMHVRKDCIELRFACSLDTQSAANPDNWHIEQWRYLWSSAYGSPEFSTEEPEEAPGETGRDGLVEFSKAQAAQKKHDPVVVKSVSIGTDDRTVILEIPNLKPVMQMAIAYDIRSAGGQEIRGEVVNTIHALNAQEK